MMDFLRPEFSGYFEDRESLCRAHGLNPAKRMMLYISSFGYASMDEDEVRQLSDMAGTDFTEFAKVNREGMTETLAWFERYLEAHPEVELVYRRHPSEWSCPQLAALAEKRQNFHIIFSGSVKQWITAADTIGIWMSSAVAEVYFAGKTCHVLRPHPIPHEFDPVIYNDARTVSSYEAFTAAMAAEDPPFPIAPAMIEAYFSHDAKTPAYVRMANLLEEVHKNPPRTEPFSAGYTPHFNWLKCFALVGVHILFALRLNPARFARVAPGFASFAGRIYGYIEKAHLPKGEAEAMRQRIRRFVP